MKKVYSQPTLAITAIKTATICIGSVKSNLNLKQGVPVLDYSDAV